MSRRTKITAIAGIAGIALGLGLGACSSPAGFNNPATLGTAIARWQGGVGRQQDGTGNPNNITDHAACSAETTPGQ